MILTTLPVSAQEVQFPRIEGEDPAAGPAHLVRYLYVLGLGLGGVLAFAMIAIAGLQWTLSGANPSIQSDAKDRILNAVFGLLLLLAAFVILRTINPELVNLREPDLRGLRVPPPAERQVGGIVPASHTQCRNSQCVTVPGPGINQCRLDTDCKYLRNVHVCGSGPGADITCKREPIFPSLETCRQAIPGCPLLKRCVPVGACRAFTEPIEFDCARWTDIRCVELTLPCRNLHPGPADKWENVDPRTAIACKPDLARLPRCNPPDRIHWCGRLR
jgi:hypothetical protein